MYGNPIQVPVKPAPTTDLYGNPLQPPPPAQQQACYGNTSSAGQQSKPNTVRLDTSSFSKVSVEVAREHMELLNTFVSAYCGLVEGQIGNINLTQEDYQQIDKEEMDLMDIKWAFASAVRRAKDFMERTGRTSLESKKDTKYGFDKQVVKCFNCGERGHFKRECTRPAQHGNQNPFRNQGNQQNQNRNNERTLIPVNNQSQAGTSNANRALVVQVDEGCDWSIQLSGDAPDGTACFAEVVKDLVHTSGGESSANGDESSEDEDSSGYSRSSDEESSSSGDDHVGETSSASVDADIDELLEEAASGTQRRSILVDQAVYSSSSLHSAFMANVDSSSSQGVPGGTISSHWIVDSGASRHMIGDMKLLYDVKSIRGGYVAFAGDKGGYITGEGMISNGIVSFDKINFVQQLDHNLLSVSQICDKQFSVHFDANGCYVLNPGFKIPKEWILLSAPRINDLYVLDMSQAITTSAQATCFVSKATEKDSISWHGRMGHIHLRKMNHLVSNELVNGVPLKNFHLQDVCFSCQKGKQTKKKHPTKKINTVAVPLERLHMDLFGPLKHKSIRNDQYCLVIIDDYSRFSWVAFMAHKSETFGIIKNLIIQIENLYKLKVRRIRSDNGTEFKNHAMAEFCTSKGILHEFSAAYTPQQNGVAERKNRTLIETARTMLVESQLRIPSWSEAVASACYTLNRVLTVKRHNKTCFELFHKRKPDLSYLEPFGAPCTMIDPNGKFGQKQLTDTF
ncbi:putative RNA-directed DNA polymerase [Helianthus annuus]|nr:putative RNA-directed DNA polymerase [Helianthus annuus]